MGDLQQALERNPHLAAFLDAWARDGGSPPAYHGVLSSDLKNARPLNVLYPVGDPVFIHVTHAPGDLFPRYRPVEPAVEAEHDATYQALREQLFLRAPEVAAPASPDENAPRFEELLDRVLKGLTVPEAGSSRRRRGAVPPEIVELMRYRLTRDVLGYGRLEPLIRDPWIEDINGIGTTDVHVVHKLFGMTKTTIRFPDPAILDAFLETLSERGGRRASYTHPVVDGSLPNGNRFNMVYGQDISPNGSSFTIRKQQEKPVAITQLIAWNTMSSRLAAYLWLCVESGLNVFVSGETASGKTTSLNALLAFIPLKNKIITAEDTPEVYLPHENWQQLVTRDRGVKESRVAMYELLRAALRSRPNYIVVGEIRGQEGAVAFQAMQAGHTTMATFHASTVAKLIQRFSSDPIRVPVQFMGSLNVVLLQSAVYLRGRVLRRVVAVEEIEGFSKRANAAVTRQVFTWDPNQDVHAFGGRNNSYVLETLVAPRLRMHNRHAVYEELERRANLLDDLVARQVFDYQQVADILFGLTPGEKAEAPRPSLQAVTAR